MGIGSIKGLIRAGAVMLRVTTLPDMEKCPFQRSQCKDSIMNGYYDLATYFTGVEHSIAILNIPQICQWSESLLDLLWSGAYGVTDLPLRTLSVRILKKFIRITLRKSNMKRAQSKRITVFLIQKVKTFGISVGHFFLCMCRCAETLIVKIYDFPKWILQLWRAKRLVNNRLGLRLKLAELLAWLPEQDTRASLF